MIAARIEQARMAIGLKVISQFCDAVGVRAPTYYRWTKGQNVPDIFSLHAIADVCRVSMEWLVAGVPRSGREALEEWRKTPSGHGAPPEAIVFLEQIDLMGYEANALFYDLAYLAWQRGLSTADAARLAKVTGTRRPQSGR